MNQNCEICKSEIEVTLCCSGFECGCMGMPTEPPLCEKKECWEKWIKNDRNKKQ